ncbi:di-trans,poly-cis-decaprenylcistransferase [Candidatus Woesearchaeota archaeon]|nr:MAG: di-trans,poly-cis-decaprenylcistransferase [Candidatus Woesearchaeota archaeon]
MHVAVILDGNRRFAKRLLKNPWEGHEYGAQKVKNLCEWCCELGVTELTLYAFSWQNRNRPKTEFNYLMKIFSSFVDEALEENSLIFERRIRINPIGRYAQVFPEDLVKRLDQLKELTQKFDRYTLNIALAYGGREEIVDAVKKVGRMIEAGTIRDEEISEELIASQLYLSSEPDIIIRTGGDHRTSNFLAWQSIYSEWFFIEKTWPEFEQEDLLEILEQFSQRERRFGK